MLLACHITDKQQFERLKYLLIFGMLMLILAACGQATSTKNNTVLSETSVSTKKEASIKDIVVAPKEIQKPDITPPQENAVNEAVPLSITESKEKEIVVKKTKKKKQASLTKPPKKPIILPKRPISKTPIFVNEDPDQFINKDIGAITNILGSPQFARRDGNIEVWQYRRGWENGRCHLDLFIYPVDSTLKVKFVDLRGENIAEPNIQNCFIEILKDQVKRQNPVLR